MKNENDSAPKAPSVVGVGDPGVVVDSITRNQLIVMGLRELADFIEGHPDLPSLSSALAYESGWGATGRTKLLDAHKVLAPCTTLADDYNVTISKVFAGDVKLQYSVNRDAVCKRITSWKCNDAELMKTLGLEKKDA